MKIKPLDILAVFLAIPALVGVLDAWLYVFVGKAVLVDWSANNAYTAFLLAVLALAVFIRPTNANR